MKNETPKDEREKSPAQKANFELADFDDFDEDFDELGDDFNEALDDDFDSIDEDDDDRGIGDAAGRPVFDFTTRFFQAPKMKKIGEKFLKYAYAEQLAREIELSRDCRFFVVVNGSFYFGDFLEAIIERYNFKIKKLTVQTLSLNQNNVDSLGNLLANDYVDRLDLIVSDFFFSHERRALIPYIYKELDGLATEHGKDFQLAATRTHCKIASFETYDGVFLTIHGSANLRTSDNLEQIVIEDNEALYRFNDQWQTEIVEKYKTIDKSVKSFRGASLWETITKNEKGE